MIELKNSKTTYLGKASGRDSYSLDAFIGAVQMRAPDGPWQDIRPCLVRDADGWHIEGAPYYAEIKDDGARLFCPDRNERHNYLRLPAPALFSGLARNVISNPARLDGTSTPNQITMPADWGEMRIIFSNTGMHFEMLFTKAPPAALFGKDSPRILLDAETAGLDIEQLLSARVGIGIPQPRLMSANPEILTDRFQEKWLDWNYKNGQLELGFDFADLEFPILLKNTTVDVQVGASADDGIVQSGGGLTNNSDIFPGYYNYEVTHAFARFTGITIPQGSTITVCYYSIYEYISQNSPLTKIHFEKAQNPGVISSWSDYLSRTLTTAGVDWDGDPGGLGWCNSPSLITPMQELINAYGLSNQAIQVMHKDDGSSIYNYMWYRGWDYSGHTYGPKLHIEYSTGGATAKTSAETGAGAEGSALQAAMQRAETAGGVDTRQSLLAGLTRNENGTGVEQSLLTSLVARLAAETGSGIETRSLVAGLFSSDVGHGVDTGVIPGLKGIFGNDGGIGYDALKALIGTSGAVSDMKLPGRQGQVRIPSKGVSL